MKHKPYQLSIWKSEEEIHRRICEMAFDIQQDFNSHPIHVVGTIRDGFIFFSDLVRAIHCPVRCQFIHLAYKESSRGEGQFMEIDETVLYPQYDLKDLDILIATVMMDTGVIVDNITSRLRLLGARSVKVATLVDKPLSRRVAVNADYVGFTQDHPSYLCGFGLDLEETNRNLPYLASVKFLSE